MNGLISFYDIKKDLKKCTLYEVQKAKFIKGTICIRNHSVCKI